MKVTRRHPSGFVSIGAALCGLLCLLAGAARAGETLRYVDLLKRVADVEQIALLPEPGERAAQFSSYDRRSRFDEPTGKYVEWAVNDDFGQFLREENGWQVMAEAEGPGCIWRMWCPSPKNAQVRLIVDGEEVVTQPFERYFAGPSPFDRRNISYEAARGWNSYLPIPFNRSVKVLTDAKPGTLFFYHINWSAFPKGTQVESFRLPLTAEQNAALDALNQRLGEPSALPKREGQQSVRCEQTVAPGTSVVLFDLKGPGAVQGLGLTLDLPPEIHSDREALFKAYREWVVEIRWDGEKEPSVRAPFADFFGAISYASYHSLIASFDRGSGWCGWFMPFARSAVISVRNEGAVPRTVSGSAVTVPLSQPIQKYGHFHAKWHRDEKEQNDPDRGIDWSLLRVQGRGRYVGCMLHVWNSLGGWWGEGDEKFFVDGERFPSTFGTGSEDYFGYAWCCGDYFERPLHNQPLKDERPGHACVNRFHTADAIPFQKSFDGFLEKYFTNQRGTLYAATPFFYLEMGLADGYRDYSVAERRDYCRKEGALLKIAGAQEGEKLRRMDVPSGKFEPKFRGAWGERDRSGEADGCWSDGTIGDVLKLGVQIPRNGRYRVIIPFSTERFSGICGLSLDGKTLIESIDLYTPTFMADVARKEFGPVELQKGEAVLSIALLGKNPNASGKENRISFDYIQLEFVDGEN